MAYSIESENIFGNIFVRAVIRQPHKIKEVLYKNPRTIVIWEDGSKTVVKAQKGDVFSEEVGLAMAIVKKHYPRTKYGKPSQFEKAIAKARRL